MAALIRPAAEPDLPTLARIYNAGILGRNATFETRLRVPDDLRGWLAGPGPCLVLQKGGSVLGFARGGEYSNRECYAGILDHGVYVAPEAQGRGYGAALLLALQEAARAAGFHKLTSRVFVRNSASRAAHRKAGFREVGTHLRHAQLDGEWLDVVTVELSLWRAINPPSPSAPKPESP
ncbi:arsinothricin resistance N-acetyltransferase ArsN1 family A [Deinococcus rubellus]|uniref:Arsinothricin resistance N-acetyltransferase ArsN1 n=1 Tax=Deinococcus rubellus TaxID=1889240 RepID=A0ABY5YPB2_9DEIO|nr:arsinothricin resistance N-acetyltransferase ArsN1 family A [Deinococcus rubellus]UWX65558.1 arsinothricin resistance N-acetyltransferase ArsN1 [Deinococcus rubellus]